MDRTGRAHAAEECKWDIPSRDMPSKEVVHCKEMTQEHRTHALQYAIVGGPKLQAALDLSQKDSGGWNALCSDQGAAQVHKCTRDLTAATFSL
jgi:hypothetical protein